MHRSSIDVRGLARAVLVPPTLLALLAGVLLSAPPLGAEPLGQTLGTQEHAGVRLTLLKGSDGQLHLLDEVPGRGPRVTPLGIPSAGPVVSHFATGPGGHTYAAFSGPDGIDWLALGRLDDPGVLQPLWLATFGEGGDRQSYQWELVNVIVSSLTARPPSITMEGANGSATYVWDGTRAQRLRLEPEEPLYF